MQILVVKLSSLGDLFHALPAVHALKRGLGAEVDWVTQPEYAEVVRCFTDVRDVIAFPRRGGLGGWRAFLGCLRAQRYAMAVDLQGLAKSAIVIRLARVSRRIGPSYHREGSRLLYSAVAGPRNRERHAVDQALDVVRFLGLSAAEPVFSVNFPPRPVDAPRPRVAVIPSSRWPTKNWPPACFAQVADLLQKRRAASVFLLGGREDAPVCQGVAAALTGRTVNLAGTLGLAECGGLLREMDLVLSNDSGPGHMAAALGTPTLMVFGPTDPRRTGPYGSAHRAVAAKVDCRPCFSRACHRGGLACLSGVTPERVGDMALEMLARG
jgi:lipopolysaccharide heptosyltransferase II